MLTVWEIEPCVERLALKIEEIINLQVEVDRRHERGGVRSRASIRKVGAAHVIRPVQSVRIRPIIWMPKR